MWKQRASRVVASAVSAQAAHSSAYEAPTDLPELAAENFSMPTRADTAGEVGKAGI